MKSHIRGSKTCPVSINYRRKLVVPKGAHIKRIVLPITAFKIHVEWSSSRRKILYILHK